MRSIELTKLDIQQALAWNDNREHITSITNDAGAMSAAQLDGDGETYSATIVCDSDVMTELAYRLAVVPQDESKADPDDRDLFEYAATCRGLYELVNEAYQAQANF